MRKRPLRKDLDFLPDIGIGKRLRRAHMAFSREFRNRLAECGVTFGQFIHLERLWEEDGLNQTELSRRVGIASPSSTAILDSLEKRGHIRRQRNSADQRNINVFLTAAGAKLKNELMDCAKDINRLARSGMTKDEIVMLFSALDRIIDNLDKPAAKPESVSVAKPPRKRQRLP